MVVGLDPQCFTIGWNRIQSLARLEERFGLSVPPVRMVGREADCLLVCSERFGRPSGPDEMAACIAPDLRVVLMLLYMRMVSGARRFACAKRAGEGIGCIAHHAVVERFAECRDCRFPAPEPFENARPRSLCFQTPEVARQDAHAPSVKIDRTEITQCEYCIPSGQGLRIAFQVIEQLGAKKQRICIGRSKSQRFVAGGERLVVPSQRFQDPCAFEPELRFTGPQADRLGKGNRRLIVSIQDRERRALLAPRDRMIRVQCERLLEALDRVLEVTDVLGAVVGVMRQADVLHPFLEAGLGFVHGR